MKQLTGCLLITMMTMAVWAEDNKTDPSSTEFVTKTHARLGETVELIESDLGPLKPVDDSLYPNELLFGVAHRQEGFDALYFKFLKTTRRCVEFRYGKGFKTLEDINIGFVDALKIIEKTFFGLKPVIVKSEGIKNLKQETVIWSASWKAQNGAKGQADVHANRYGGCDKYAFVVLCQDPSYLQIESLKKPNVH